MSFVGATFDSREVRPGMAFVALKGEKVDGHDFIAKALDAGASQIIDGLAELQAVAAERRRALKAKVIGVTGSAGKTTTKELLKAFLAAVGKTYATSGNFNNHIGLPITILNCPLDADFLILEMGTNHPGEIKALCEIARPDAGLITNIGTAHLEFFKTQDGIAEEKGTLFEYARDFSVVSSENVRLACLRKKAKSPLIEVNPASPWLASALKPILPGEHNVANATLAFAVAEQYGLTPNKAELTLKDFALPGARWRKLQKDGINFIDDSYNANPDSMMAAISAFEREECNGRKLVVLGDMFELGEAALQLHAQVFDFTDKKFDQVIAVGELSSKCKADLKFNDAASLKAAFSQVFHAGDTVLIKASHSMNLSVITQ